MAACYKLTYDRRADASRASLMFRGVNRYRLTPYRCGVCGKWHLTSAAWRKPQ